MTTLNAYLKFNGDCREAMNFYKDCLGGELVIQTVGESPMADKMPPEAKQNVMHSTLTRGDMVLMGSDTMMPGALVRGNSVALSLICISEEEIRAFFSKLSDGGKVTLPLNTEYWGAIFGGLIDR